MTQSVRTYLELGFTGAPDQLRDMQTIARLSTAEAADFCLVTRGTYERWRSQRNTNRTAVRLMAMRAGFIPWPEWQSFIYCPADGLLYHRDLKYGFSAQDVMNLGLLKQQLGALEKENRRLRLQLQEARAATPADETSTLPPAERLEEPAGSNVVPFPQQEAVVPVPSSRATYHLDAQHVLQRLRRWVLDRANESDSRGAAK